MFKKFGGVAAFLLLFGSFFVVVIFALFRLGDSVSFFYTPTAFFEKGLTGGESLRIGGMVVKDSVYKCGRNGSELCFVVTDFKKDVKVRYEGVVLPPLFSPGKGVVAEGIYQNGYVRAFRLLSKHGPRYMPNGR